MNRRFLPHVWLGVVMASVLVVTPAAPATAQTPPPTGQAVFSDITVHGTVDAVDYGARTVRIRGDQGNLITLDVPTSYTRFQQVKAGDTVTITYSDRMTIKPKPPGEPAVDKSTPMTTPTPGLAPGGRRVTERVTTATIDAWDPTTRIVTFTTPAGQYTRRMADTTDPALTAGLKAGDRVDVTRTEAVNITVAPSGAQAAPQAPATPAAKAPDTFKNRSTIAVLYGLDNTTNGDILKGGSGTFQSTPISFTNTSYDDVYGTMELLKIGYGYRTSPRAEANINFIYSKSGAKEVQIGTYGLSNAPVTAKFDDYSYWGFEGGQRFYFTRVRATPFVGYTIGANHFSEIGATLSSPPTATTGPIVVPSGNKFFDSSWAFSAGFTTGLLIGVGPIEFMAETGFRYFGGLSDVPALAETSLKDINSDSARWSVPVLFGIRVRF